MSKNKRHNSRGTHNDYGGLKSDEKRAEQRALIRRKAKSQMQKGEYLDLPTKAIKGGYWRY